KWKQKHEQLDSAILSYAICKASTDLDKIKPALDETIALINNCKGEDGTIYYRSTIPSIRFVDTIGFICPFLTFYGSKFNKSEYIDLAIFQIKDYIQKAFWDSPFIPAHAFDLSKNIPLGVYGWGRGLGWFILGLVDMYNELDENHKEKEYFKKIIIKTAKDTLKFQKADGGFNAMIGVEGSRHDSSITVLAGWLFYNAFSVTNKKKYLIAAHCCVDSLMKATRRNGVIDFCQGDTKGIGIYASTFDLMPFVQGLTLRLVNKLSRNVQ
ncbi:glycoside hydrolase family 88 protein, partial [Yeosuana marina]|uniref:glycoside hydrolase family 88 protein n=1 Tax=Yeosuana marina TaxID=1565536 RepID=UPI0030C8A1F3